MSTAARERLRQRADYTHKHNFKTGRHGWLRLTPAYSVKVVEELIEQCDRPMRIYDPFSGTATTALSAAYYGHEGVTTDVNPFLVWLGQAKTAYYPDASLVVTQCAGARALDLVRRRAIDLVPAPPIHNIERWWGADALAFLQALRAAVEATTEPYSDERTLLLVAFCRILITLSNAAFNHQSMSFKETRQLPFALGTDMAAMFSEDVRFVLNGAADNPSGPAKVILGDARNATLIVNGPFDRIITSPPYANRMSYIRELRPYMYWLGYLVNGRDAGELDWSAIGGTWGMATSRLLKWTRAREYFANELLQNVLQGISQDDNQSGYILSKYVEKYFDDMWCHFQSIIPILAPNAEVHYIIGNSTFYGVLVSVEKIYVTMLAQLGFTDIECRPIRKRNSKKELIEFDVTARWRG